MEYKKQEIAERIRSKRKEKGCNQGALIEALSYKGVRVGRNTLSNIENGDFSHCSLNLLIAVCEILGCDIGYIVGEYDYSTKETAEICKETGLSEKAIEKIFKWKRSGFGDFSMDLISEMIEDDELLPEILRAGYDIEEIRNNRTQSAPKENIRFNHGAVTLVDPKTSINFLAFIIQKHITDFVFSYFQIKEDNSEDAEK